MIINSTGDNIGTMDISSNFFDNNSDDEGTQMEDSLLNLEIQHAKKVAQIIHKKLDESIIDDRKLLRKTNWVNDKNNSFSYLEPCK